MQAASGHTEATNSRLPAPESPSEVKPFFVFKMQMTKARPNIDGVEFDEMMPRAFSRFRA